MALNRRPILRGAAFSAALAALLSAAAPALAQSEPAPAPVVSPAPPAADSGSSATDKPVNPFERTERPWLYSPDATAPPPLHVLASLGVGYADIDRAVGRPFAGNLVNAGAVFNAGAEVGLFRFVSVHAEGLFAGTGGAVNAGALVGVTFYPMPKESPVDVAVSGGYMRELGGSDGVWARVTAAGNLGPVRLNLSGLGAHVFAPNRDAIDLVLTAGASYKIASFFRLGVEYVVQDIEGAWEEEEEEGGIRHFLSPTASFELHHRIHITAGPAFGLSPQSPGVLGRLQAGYAF